ncbi:hypothetical protein LJB91_00745 [Bacteroidales bacterium OttesenSCG-928-L03]|nr:hypothetical protein [Bacteroidales bacterium OttesenSCG-928-L03]
MSEQFPKYWSALLAALFLSFFFIGCEEKRYLFDEFEAPILELVSVQPLSAQEMEVTVKIEIRTDLSILDASFYYQNISTEEMSTDRYLIKLNKEKEQIYTFKIKTTQANQDYKVWLSLKTAKNEYLSTPQLVRLGQLQHQNQIKSVELYIPSAEVIYMDVPNGVGLNMNWGETFMFLVHYYEIPPEGTKTEIKLNGEIPIQAKITYYGWKEDSYVSGGATLPDDIPPGIYTIHVYIDDVEYILTSKIRVLPGRGEWVEIALRPNKNSYIGDVKNYFLVGDKVYYIHNAIAPFTLLCYDFTKRSWESPWTLSLDTSYAMYSKLEMERIHGEGKNYMIVNKKVDQGMSIPEYAGMFLLELEHKKKSWTELTQYPGKGTQYFTTFCIGDVIYMGGGRTDAGAWEIDFWSYNTKDKSWTRLNDLPYTKPFSSNFVNATARNQNEVYLFTCDNDLYRYDSLTDQWDIESVFKDLPISRFYANLLYKDNKLYLVGGSQGSDVLRDIWEYDLATKEWTLIDLMNGLFSTYRIPSFFYGDDLYIGSGSRGYGDTDYFYKVHVK